MFKCYTKRHVFSIGMKRYLLAQYMSRAFTEVKFACVRDYELSQGINCEEDFSEEFTSKREPDFF